MSDEEYLKRSGWIREGKLWRDRKGDTCCDVCEELAISIQRERDLIWCEI